MSARSTASEAFSANLQAPAILERELRALMMWDDGNRSGAVELLREAARLEDAIPLEFGPPDVVKPSHELLGELLVAAGPAR